MHFRRMANKIKYAVGVLTVSDWVWLEGVNEMGNFIGSLIKEPWVIPTKSQFPSSV